MKKHGLNHMKVAELEARLRAAVTAGDVLGTSLALIEDGQTGFAGGYAVTAAGETGAPLPASRPSPT